MGYRVATHDCDQEVLVLEAIVQRQAMIEESVVPKSIDSSLVVIGDRPVDKTFVEI